MELNVTERIMRCHSVVPVELDSGIVTKELISFRRSRSRIFSRRRRSVDKVQRTRLMRFPSLELNPVDVVHPLPRLIRLNEFSLIPEIPRPTGVLL